MDRWKAIAGALLGAGVGAVQFLLTRSYTHAPSDPGIGGIGQAFGRGLVVVVVTLVGVSIAAAILRLRYWAAVGIAATMGQALALIVARPLAQQAGWHADSSLLILPITLTVVLALTGLLAPAKVPRDYSV
jgi:hypothetical protein